MMPIVTAVAQEASETKNELENPRKLLDRIFIKINVNQLLQLKVEILGNCWIHKIRCSGINKFGTNKFDYENLG